MCEQDSVKIDGHVEPAHVACKWCTSFLVEGDESKAFGFGVE